MIFICLYLLYPQTGDESQMPNIMEFPDQPGNSVDFSGRIESVESENELSESRSQSNGGRLWPSPRPKYYWI